MMNRGLPNDLLADWITLRMSVVVGVLSLQNYQKTKEAQIFASLNETELDIVENIELVENYEIIEDIEFLEDWEVIENLEEWDSISLLS